MYPLRRYIAMAFSLLGTLAGQSRARQDLSTMDKIVLMPVVDGRAGKKQKINFEKLRKHAVKDLEKKGYTVSLPGHEVPGTYVMELTLEEVVSGGVPGARFSGKLNDDQGRVIWIGAGSGAYHSALEQPPTGVTTLNERMESATGAVLTDLLFRSAGWARGEALDDGLADLLKGIPRRTHSKQKVRTPKR